MTIIYFDYSKLGLCFKTFSMITFFGLNSTLASSYLSRGRLGKIGLNWAKTGLITNRGKFKTSFESYSLSLASFVCWSKLYYSSFILVIWLFKLNKMKLG